MKPATILAIRTSLASSSGARGVASAYRITAIWTVLLTGTVCPAQDALIKLIPADAPVLAGMQRSSTDNEYDRVSFATAKNLNDFKDLNPLTDIDPSRRFDRVIVAASPAVNDLLGDHLLLAQGRFDLTAIAQRAASSVVDFHDVAILVLNQPSNPGAEVRWLANIQNGAVLFGSPSAVQKALLRYESDERTDPAVIGCLGRIPRRDIAWSSITLNPQVLKSHWHLDAYERNAVPSLTVARKLVFGVRFDSHARLDFVVTAGSPQDAGTSIVCLRYLADPKDPIDMRTPP
jgi:hypothetical protein